VTVPPFMLRNGEPAKEPSESTPLSCSAAPVFTFTALPPANVPLLVPLFAAATSVPALIVVPPE